jgi:integrase
MVQAMALGGLRRAEVIGLRLEDLRLGEWRVFVADGKGGHQRLVPVSPCDSAWDRKRNRPTRRSTRPRPTRPKCQRSSVPTYLSTMSSARLHAPAATHRSHHQTHYSAGMIAAEMKLRSDDAGANPSTTRDDDYRDAPDHHTLMRPSDHSVNVTNRGPADSAPSPAHRSGDAPLRGPDPGTGPTLGRGAQAGKPGVPEH